MEMNKEKLLYRIFKEDAQGMDMKEFYHKRRKGFLPFLNSKGEVVWLKRREFRIAAVKKRIHIKKSKTDNHRIHTHLNEEDESNTFIRSDKYKYFIMGACTTILVYLFVKLLELLQIF